MAVPISKRLILVNSASAMVTRLVSMSVLVWVHARLVRRISPEEYSLLAPILALLEFVPLATVVLTSGLGRFIVEAYARNDQRRVTAIVSTMFPLVSTVACVRRTP